MYQRKDDEEISFIIDDTSPPSGHSRFGCWVCTVVEKDKALMSLIEDGHPEYKPLLDFRDDLKEMRDNPDCRESYRKNQRVDKFVAEYTNTKLERQVHRDHKVLGPFNLETRHELLTRLLKIQDDLRKTIPDVELISPEEIRAIELLWVYDGDTTESIQSITPNGADDSIDRLVSRLLKIEEDMSDLSKRVGVYKKLEHVIMEYTMNNIPTDVVSDELDLENELGANTNDD